MFNWLLKFRMGLLHATYHRNLKRAQTARQKQDVVAFKQYIYRAEDAWRRLVILTEKLK